MSRSVCLLLALLAIAPSVLAADAIVVSQHNRKFWPATMDLPKGGVIRIVNDDRVTHHVYVDASGMSYDSGEMPVGTSLTLEFDHEGVFPVRCAIHPTMHLDVTVH
ncbi:MAG: hypothetical protein P4L71_21090 [Acetobacteraceae bacterium]|nr:hypothetical protein [Acetobacteraceae bacterium]